VTRKRHSFHLFPNAMKHTFRRLLYAPVFTAMALLTLAIGIGAKHGDLQREVESPLRAKGQQPSPAPASAFGNGLVTPADALKNLERKPKLWAPVKRNTVLA
jgi:hypothetical protein